MIKACRQHQIIWAIFDWARTVWPVMIITFVFPNYFTTQVAATAVEGKALWADTVVISSIFIAIMAPVLGLLSDTMKNSTPWFRVFTIINIACAYLLWFVYPSPDSIVLAMTLTIIGTIGFELSGTFYNGYLSLVTKPSELSRISGIAWAMGYFAGIGCLILCLVLLVIPEEPLFGYISTDNLAHIRLIGPIVGTWYLVFGLPMLTLSETKGSSAKVHLPTLAKQAYQQMIDSIKKSQKTFYIFHFLITRMLYTDGINTLFLFAGIYAATEFNMGFDEIMYFGIACNLSAGIGCFLASITDSYFGEKSTINASLVLLSIFLIILLNVTSKFYFWVFAVIATVFIGPLQTSSRSLMAKICPEESKGEFFGLYALSGRVTSFLGPALLSFVSQQTGSEAYGMATILIFLALGLVGMLYLKIPEAILLPKAPDQSE